MNMRTKFLVHHKGGIIGSSFDRRCSWWREGRDYQSFDCSPALLRRSVSDASLPRLPLPDTFAAHATLLLPPPLPDGTFLTLAITFRSFSPEQNELKQVFVSTTPCSITAHQKDKNPFYWKTRLQWFQCISEQLIIITSLQNDAYQSF